MTHTASHFQCKCAAHTARRLEQSMSHSPCDSPHKHHYEPSSPPYQYQTKMKMEVAEDPSSQRYKRKRTTNTYSKQVFWLGATTSSPSLVCTLCLVLCEQLPKLQHDIPMGWISLTVQMERQNATGLLEWNHSLLWSRDCKSSLHASQHICSGCGATAHGAQHCPHVQKTPWTPFPWLLRSQCLGTATCNPQAICSTFLCPTSSDRNRSEPLGTNRIPSRHPISTRNLSGSDWIPSRFWVEIVCSESDQFRVDSDRNLRIFFLKNSLFVFFYLIYRIYYNNLDREIPQTRKHIETHCIFVSGVKWNWGKDPELLGEYCQTRRTRPHGCVVHVWAVGGAGKGAGTPHRRCREGVGNIPDMKNVTTGSRSSYLGGRGWWEGCRDIPDTKTWPQSRIFVSGVWKTIPDMKNATLWSRSSYLGGRGWWEGCKDIPDTKTRPWGRVLVSGVWKTIPDTKNATPDRVLRVRVVESNARGRGEGTLERAHKGTF